MTFGAFRRRFPEVSGYCHCADSQGRELAETGEPTLRGGVAFTRPESLSLVACRAEVTVRQAAVGVQEAWLASFHPRCFEWLLWPRWSHWGHGREAPPSGRRSSDLAGGRPIPSSSLSPVPPTL